MPNKTNPQPTSDLSAEDRFEILSRMTEGLHALLFGVQSGHDPDHALEAVSDGGEVHEYVHGMLRLLLPRAK